LGAAKNSYGLAEDIPSSRIREGSSFANEAKKLLCEAVRT